MKIITAYATKNDCYKTATPMTPVGIIIHSTGVNNPNLKRYVDCPKICGKNLNGNHWNNPSSIIGEVCVHSFIGYDKNREVMVANILPYNMAAWGVGRGPKGSFNYNPNGHIQIEICEDNLTNKKYCRDTYNAAVEYVAELCEQFNFNPTAPGVIVSHKESHDMGYGSNHVDPHHWWSKHGFTMDQFRIDVLCKTCGVRNPPKSIEAPPYLVRVCVPILNVRSGAGLNNPINGRIKMNEVYTIIEEKFVDREPWGRLKSGAGWIAMKYVSRT